MDRTTVGKVLEQAKAIKIMGLDFVLSFGIDGICEAYNGIGPQFFPENMRDGVTRKLAIFEPAAMGHDCRFHKSDGTRESFEYANNEFVINCRKCAKAAYPWYSWRRYRAYVVIDAMDKFNSSEMGGWRAWQEAYQKNRAA